MGIRAFHYQCLRNLFIVCMYIYLSSQWNGCGGVITASNYLMGLQSRRVSGKKLKIDGVRVRFSLISYLRL